MFLSLVVVVENRDCLAPRPVLAPAA